MIDIDKLSFSYAKTPFIEDISFAVDRGEIFGFLGPSGAGKSTLQKLLIGLLPGYGGSIRVFGREVSKHGNDFYERIGIDFEFPTLYEKLTARQNLNFFGSLYSGKLRGIDQLLAAVELAQDADKRVADYSKGMKSRLNFIRALLHDPDILFLDEPTSGLDPANARLVKDMIREEKAQGKTVILTTHNMQDAQELCDRVAFIVGGRVKSLDSPHNLIMRRGAGKVCYTYAGEYGELVGHCDIECTGADEKLQALIRLGKLLSIHSAEPNLGDIFMEVTGRALQ